MKKIIKIIFIIIFTVSGILFLNINLIYAADTTDTPTPTNSITPTSAPPDNSGQIRDLQNQINDLSGKITTLQGQEKTLSSQIGVFDSQIQLTQLRIQSANDQIVTLESDIQTAAGKITTINNSLDNLTKVLLNKIVATYEVGNAPSTQVLLASSTLSDFFTRVNYLRIVQAHDKRLIYDTVQAKNDYANQKNIFENKKKQIESLQAQLQSYTVQINQEKQSKQALLTETQGNEATYQRLLSQAKSQVAALSNFATSRAGGETIISHSDLSDDFGKYYNQRDTNWGNNLIGLSSERIWQVGCLITSYAMVSSHFGSIVTPADVAGNSDNFSLSTAMFRLPGPAPVGHSVSYASYPSMDTLRTELNNHNPIIAGLSKDGGAFADHWVVLRSVDGNSFKINDPWYNDALNVSLNDNYAGWSIVGARIYH